MLDVRSLPSHKKWAILNSYQTHWSAFRLKLSISSDVFLVGTTRLEAYTLNWFGHRAPSGWLSQHEPVSRKYAGCWNDPGTSPLINCLKLQRWNGQSTLWATAQTPATCLVLQKWNQPYWQSNVCRFECKEEKRSGKKTKYLLIVLRFGHVSVQI